MTGKLGTEFFVREGIKLFEEDDCSGIVFPLLSFGAQLMADLAGADQDAIGFSDFGVRQYVLEI